MVSNMVDTSLSINLNVNPSHNIDQTPPNHLIEELNRKNLENKRLTDMLSNVCNNYKALQSHLVAVMQSQLFGDGVFNPRKRNIEDSNTDGTSPKRPKEIQTNISRVYVRTDPSDKSLELNISQSEQSCRRFSLAEIQSATYNFDDALVLGEGGFGKVYKGVIDNGATTVAIKRLNPMSKQGAPEFWREIEMLSKIRHGHIVSFIGYCNQLNEMLLVYEYMVRGTLADHLHKFGRDCVNKFTLSWVERLKICIGAAHGLNHLHTGMGVKERVIHRDVKSSNILLDENWAAKISDFGLSKIGPANQSTTHVSTDVKGTRGYLDIEYFLTHRLTRKSDVYAFGVVLFEVLCGRPAMDFRLDVEQRSLARWVHQCIKDGKLYQIIDPDLSGQILPDSLAVFEKIADQCLHNSSKKRPTMAEVVVSLERALALQERIDSSMLEGELFDIGGNFLNQEYADSYMEQHEVINADSFVKQQEVINAGNDLHEELIDGIGRLGNASNEQRQIDENANNSQSHVNPAKTVAFIRKLRLFFFAKARGR